MYICRKIDKKELVKRELYRKKSPNKVIVQLDSKAKPGYGSADARGKSSERGSTPGKHCTIMF